MLLPPEGDTPAPGGPAPEALLRSASELRAGDYVVYPGHGVHRVAGLERMEVAGQQLEGVKLVREHDGAAVIVPVGKVPAIGLRRVAARELVEDVFHLLGAARESVELDWRERHRENVARLMTGGVLGVAEVVKGLHALARIRPLPPAERERYDEARHLLVQEVAVSLEVPRGVAEDYVDYALAPPAGVQLPLRPPPAPRPSPWFSRRLEPRRMTGEERREGIPPERAVRAAETPAVPVAREEIGPAVEGKAREAKAPRARATRGGRAGKRPPTKKRAPRRGAKGSRGARRPAGKRAARRTRRRRR